MTEAPKSALIAERCAQLKPLPVWICEIVLRHTDVITLGSRGTRDADLYARRGGHQRLHVWRRYCTRDFLADYNTLMYSLPLAAQLCPEKPVLATVLAAMLDQGTKRRSKFEVSERLEAMGATVSFYSGEWYLNFSTRCLKYVPFGRAREGGTWSQAIAECVEL